MPYFYNKNIERSLDWVLKKIQKSIYKVVDELKITAWVTPEPVPFEQRMTGIKKELSIGDKWGNLWDCAWFHFTGVVPESAAGSNVVLLIDISGEACIVDSNGCPIQGLTPAASTFDYSLGFPGKKVVPLFKNAQGGEVIDIWADAGCNDLFGVLKDDGVIKEAYIAVCNETMRELYYDFEVLYELMQHIPQDKARYHSIAWALMEACKVLRNFTEEEAKEARAILAPELSKEGGHPSLTISAIGHAHIDLAWLWPIRETIRKGARTFSTVLALMERYPDYVFGASQPQLYQWMKEYYPSLYQKIKEHVFKGRWEPQGGMWVEADTNITGGESLIRQILYGKRFFKKEFDYDVKTLWLPDSFGYTASLPQIMKKCGIEYFMTIKLSWNEYNKYPHHTFLWEGIDGSSVLVHMPPEGTYNSSAAPRAIIKAEKEYLDKGVSDRCLMLFGIGDGGGGPGEEHLERLKREKNLDGLVPVVQEPAIKFFQRLEKNKNKYQTWVGELYLEKHQGTYTSQARNKRYNRKMELELRELEWACVLSFLISGYPYPQNELERIWKEVLLYQFHDILPGSSIKRVYDESLARYEILMNEVKELKQKAYLSWINTLDVGEMVCPVAVINSLSWERDEWISVEGQWLKVKVPPMGYTVVDASIHQRQVCGLIAGDNLLENDKLRIKFAADGSIESIFDKEYNREVLSTGSFANKLAVYDDKGDAWDFPIFYDQIPCEFFTLQSASFYIDGPKAVANQVYRYGASTIEQKVVLTLGSRRVDFITKVDWHESNKMLRTSFPVNIHTNEATCDIQFGNIKRPVHRNTSWEMAKYEICAHKWVDLSQKDYGVALLNDCKYGYKVLDNVIDLNLLRSATYPDSEADRGVHEFTYALYPHPGDHVEGGVAREGYELNIPLNVIPLDACKNGAMPREKTFMEVEARNIIIETVKKAEDSDDIIIRLYENSGAGTKTKIKFYFTFKSVCLVNMMEEEIEMLNMEKNGVELYFRPYEIHTLKVSTK
ncbi:alpha-mannosidase [Caldicoprobacter faecalis]|uniref:Alpha-mannosidase n=2 Tax=Caldicoprobacter faecalis TaxID=937334 RepID=A0A1I5SCM7_9FIRM|nr:alpha-mannosidase [Caldicoprobacter faecalis]